MSSSEMKRSSTRFSDGQSSGKRRKGSSESESSSGGDKVKVSKKLKKSKKKKMSRDSYSSDSDRRSKKHKVKKHKKKEKTKKKEKEKKAKEKDKSESFVGPEIPREILEKSKQMAPMTEEEWNKKQSVLQRVYDEETGRTRLIRGSGEILEEIVSKDMHKEINKQATKGDGDYFQAVLSKKRL